MMKFTPETNTLKGLLLHVAIVVGLLFTLWFTFFYKVLPMATNRNEVVTVPDLRGMTTDEASEFLTARDLSLEVTDSSYNSALPPFTVLEQYPKASAKVKVKRKINVRLNAQRPPVVRYPDLTGAKYAFAERQLNLLELKVGAVEYRPDIAHNAILESKLNGRTVQAGERIPKGSTIDLVIGFMNTGKDL